MNHFAGNQRVRILDPDHILCGKTGRVWRHLRRDDSAWVTMDEDIPEKLARFPVGDQRRNNVNLFPDQCEAI